jgi:protein-tyrosine phosphatase
MDFSEILPNLFVGSCPRSPADIDWLKDGLGITAVLNLQTDEDFGYWGIRWERMQAAYRRAGVELRRVPVQDFNPEELRRKLPACVEALDELLRAGHTTYVHCSAGMNRSPSTVVAYLHWIRGMGLDEAMAFVLEKHPCDPYVEAIRGATEDRGGEAGR